jgi:1-phosphatidylinositol-4-phosphate 5-kinase
MNPGNTKIMIPSFKTKTGEEETAKGTPVEVEESKPIQSIHSRNPSRQSKKGDEKQFQTEDKTNELNIQRHPSVKQRNMRKDSMCTEFSSSSEETEQEVSKQEALNAPKKDTILDKMKEMQKQLQGMDNEFKNSIVEATRKEDKDVKKSFIESFKNRENGRRTVVFRTQKLSINKIQEVRHNADATNLVNIIDENWNLILNMMLGMRNSATSVHDVVKLTGDDFNVKYVFELVPRRKAGSVQTKIVSRFFDYAPNVFFKIRVKFCKFETTDYIKSIGPEQLIGNLLLGNITSLQEQCSEGKSGSFFYYTHCGRFVIKTIPHTEFRFLLKVLPKYFKHLEDHPHSLIIKVLGMHKIFYDKRKIYFIVMQNVFASSLKVDTKYDLKGSTVGRKVRINTEPLQGDFALKDLDLIDDKVKICIHPKMKFMLIKELFSDINFLSSINTDDYSFMLGIHRITDRLEVVSHKTNLSHYLNFDDSVEERPFPFFTVNEGGILSNDCSCVYFFGIIDILTEYGPKKQLEYFFKRIKYGKQMSVLPPQEYAERIMNFINSIID